jgi:glutathione S-transferase
MAVKPKALLSYTEVRENTNCCICCPTSWALPLLLLLLLLSPSQPAAQYAVHELSFQELFTSKPQWLLDLNPAGLVPFIAWKADGNNSSSSSTSWDTQAAVAAAAAAGPGAVVVRESLACNEYLEDAFPDPPVSIKDCRSPDSKDHAAKCSTHMSRWGPRHHG